MGWNRRTSKKFKRTFRSSFFLQSSFDQQLSQTSHHRISNYRIEKIEIRVNIQYSKTQRRITVLSYVLYRQNIQKLLTVVRRATVLGPNTVARPLGLRGWTDHKILELWYSFPIPSRLGISQDTY